MIFCFRIIGGISPGLFSWYSVYSAKSFSASIKYFSASAMKTISIIRVRRDLSLAHREMLCL